MLLTLLHPQSIGFAAGLLLAALNFHLPQWVLDPVSSFGQATIPMAMVATGSILSQVHLGKDVLWRMQLPAAFLKLILLPLIVLLILKAWQPGTLVAGVLLLQAAMPSLASSGIYAKRFGGDAAQAAAGSLVTTALCPLFLPLWMGLL